MAFFFHNFISSNVGLLMDLLPHHEAFVASWKKKKKPDKMPGAMDTRGIIIIIYYFLFLLV